MSDLLQHWASQLERHADAPDFAVREAAMREALNSQLPHARVESWKYTNLRAIARREAQVLDRAALPEAADVLKSVPSPRVVFVDGHYDASLSDTADLNDVDVTIRDNGEAFEHGGPANAINQVNVALNQGGVRIRVHGNADKPLHWVWLATAQEPQGSQHNTHRVVLERDASLTVVELIMSTGEHQHIATNRVELIVNESAALNHFRLQLDATTATWFAHTDVQLQADAVYRRVDAEIGGALSRHELNISLNGDRAHATSNGILFGDGKRQLDTRLTVRHRGLHTGCALVWRGLGTERSKISFHGGIHIHAGADFTEASLSNKNLLLSDNAEINSQPVLEIDADEVQAAHGTTVGQLDERALFYLRSRGIEQHTARTMLIGAFVHELLGPIEPAELREHFASSLDTALAGVEFE